MGAIQNAGPHCEQKSAAGLDHTVSENRVNDAGTLVNQSGEAATIDALLEAADYYRLLGLKPIPLTDGKTPTAARRFADFQGLQDCRQVLPGVEHRIRVLQLPHNLLWTVPLPSSRRHQGLLALRASRPS